MRNSEFGLRAAIARYALALNGQRALGEVL